MFSVEIIIYLLLGIGILVWAFWRHPARKARPSIAEEMLADHHSIEQTLNRYLGIDTPAPPPPVEVVQEVLPEVKPSEPTPLPAPAPRVIVVEKTSPQAVFDVRQFILHQLLWNKKY